jgi:hypothetical protein
VTGLLLNLATGGEIWTLIRLNLPGWYLEQIPPRRMAVLANQRDSPIRKERQRTGSSSVTNDIPRHLEAILFIKTVPLNREDRAGEEPF